MHGFSAGLRTFLGRSRTALKRCARGPSCAGKACEGELRVTWARAMPVRAMPAWRQHILIGVRRVGCETD
eukprot:364479-Chlamydomonas_euryale.AAC.7